ncbi:MAG: flagellar biosynthesis protein FlhF [Steroidobacteraceae bacterium]
MNIRRYVAASMREGLARVRDEQGPDAVIVSSARVPEGIEIIAATDYDEALMSGVAARRASGASSRDPDRGAEDTATTAPALPGGEEPRAAEPREPAGFGELLGRLVQDAVRGRRAGPRAANPGTPVSSAVPPARIPAALREAITESVDRARDPEPRVADEVVAAPGTPGSPSPSKPGIVAPADPPEPRVPPAPDVEPGRPQVVWSQDPSIVAMRQELAAMRELLETQLARLAWDDLVRREPMRARVLRDLSALDIAPDLARMIVTSMPAVTNEADASRISLALLMRHITVVARDPFAGGGVHALIGPTGAGKTTTIAKLAAHAALRHGRDAVGLVCADNHRLGAREQLAALARVLAVPLVVASSARELDAAVEGFRNRHLVLVDTAGVTRRDLQLHEESALWTRLRAIAGIHAVLPASGDAVMLAELACRERGLRAVSAIITKIDEAASLGPVLSAVMRAGLPIAHLCDGPRVPEDLHDAAPRRIWLLKRAVRLQRETRHQADEQRLAEAFGRAATHV